MFSNSYWQRYLLRRSTMNFFFKFLHWTLYLCMQYLYCSSFKARRTFIERCFGVLKGSYSAVGTRRFRSRRWCGPVICNVSAALYNRRKYIIWPFKTKGWTHVSIQSEGHGNVCELEWAPDETCINHKGLMMCAFLDHFRRLKVPLHRWTECHIENVQIMCTVPCNFLQNHVEKICSKVQLKNMFVVAHINL